VEYYDTNFQGLTASLSPGWLRYPGGATEDAFAWTNGVTLTNWIYEFPAGETNLLWPTVKLAAGKGGAKLSDFAAMCASVGGARIVVTINALGHRQKRHTRCAFSTSLASFCRAATSPAGVMCTGFRPRARLRACSIA
jgi:hypothetical protein